MPLSKQTISRRKKWMKALTSGEFKQHTRELRKQATNEMCCMGVACVVYQRETGKGRWNRGEFIVDGHFSSAKMPKPVADYFGFRSGDPGLPVSSEGESVIASRCNDDFEFSFEKIARLIARTMR
jgi:hypothetical protein